MGCHLGFLGKTNLATAKHSLAAAIRTIRKARGLSQEAFSDVSSRTYMSTLERDLKSPTLHKLSELCEVMEVHPLTLLTLAYAGDSSRKTEQLLAQVRQELEAVLKERDAP
jgi:transcriptional regulator with XRE-family HTH domain